MLNDKYPSMLKNYTRSSITVVLLDGRRQIMAYDKTTKLSTLFESTCDTCFISENDIFGFAILLDDYYAFLDLNSKVIKINFKEFSKKSQQNFLFKNPNFSPVHQVENQNCESNVGGSTRLRSQFTKAANSQLNQSCYSTQSAPPNIPPNINSITSIQDNDTPKIYFRVRSYVHPYCLRDRITKTLYFQQLLRNVLDYRIQCADEIYFQLGAYAIQAYYGDFKFCLHIANQNVYGNNTSAENESISSSSTCDYNSYYASTTSSLSKLARPAEALSRLTPEIVESGKYFEPRKFFPEWVIEKYGAAYLHNEIPALHQALEGVGRSEAEFQYIKMATRSHSSFNMHLFPIRDQKIDGTATLWSSNYGETISTTGKVGGVGIKNDGARQQCKMWLGLSPSGLEMHGISKLKTLVHISTLKWSDINHIVGKSYRINVNVGSKVLKLFVNTKMQAEHLFWLTRHMHMYQAKARLSANRTQEALELADRQRYREKYVYMDSEDRMLHEEIQPFNEFERYSFRLSDRGNKLPLSSTPAAPPRRVPTKGKPKKIKEMSRELQESKPETETVESDSSYKRPQYIKKSKLSSSNSISRIAVQNNNTEYQRPISPPGLVVLPGKVLANEIGDDTINDQSDDSNLEFGGYCTNGKDELSDIEPDEFDDSLTSPGVRRFPPNFVTTAATGGRFISLTSDNNNINYDSSSDSNVIVDKVEKDKDIIVDDNDNYSRSSINAATTTSIDLVDSDADSGTQFIDSRFRYNKNIDIGPKPGKGNLGLKSWRSDVVLNLNRWSDDDGEGESDDNKSHNNNNNSVDTDAFEGINRRLVQQQQQQQQYKSQTVLYFKSLLSSGSSCNTENEHDSVEISSLSSAE